MTLAPAGDGVKSVAVRYQDQQGRVSAAYTATITLSTALPTGSIQINAGAALTDSPAATLSLSASASAGSIVQMQFSKDGGISWFPWESFAATRSVTLTPAGPGTKRGSVRYKDTLGNVSPSYLASIEML